MASVNVSLSAYQAWQRCETKYYYGYVRRLRSLVKDIAPQRGVILHDYMATYYGAIGTGKSADDAHADGIHRIQDWDEKIRVAAATTYYAGDEKTAVEFQELIPACKRIAERYYTTHGKGDAEEYNVLVVEQTVKVQLTATAFSTSIIDLVLQDKNRGLISLTEHKTTANVPSSSVRLRDLQTLLYAEVLDITGLHVDKVLWNYLRTKEPEVPMKLKSGGLSRDKRIDTTFEIYRKAIEDEGLNPNDYEDMLERLRDRETSVFFPRYEQMIVVEPAMLMEDYAIEANRMVRARYEWENGISRPVRSMARDCDYCAFYRICEAAIMGGDEEDVIRMRFTTERERPPEPSQEPKEIEGLS